jgi:RimJ/RimL family protein N-acetyltransferase
MTELLTERLQLRVFRPEDFEAHARISADHEVMRYILPGPLTRVQAWRKMAEYVGHWQLRGYGIWSVIERSSGQHIGRIGFLNPEGGHGFEVGWGLAREAWGKGYALEGLRAALHHASTALHERHAVALIHPENARSIKIAERLGGALEGRTQDSGVSLLVFGIPIPGVAAT